MNAQRILLAAAVAAVLFSSAAVAETRDRPFPSTAVSYADLDLNTRAGRARLDRRLDEAVRTVCGSFGLYTTREAHRQQQCRSEARARLEAQRSEALAAADHGGAATGGRR